MLKKLLAVVVVAADRQGRPRQAHPSDKDADLWAEATDPVERPVADRRSSDHSGDVAQLVAHLLCKQGVEGSSPFVSTIPTRTPGSGQ